MKYLIIGLLTIYQNTLSPDHGLTKGLCPGGFCHFYPSCSEYTLLAVERFGSLRGVLKGASRLFRCNPFTYPDYDPVLR
ncbi:MAG: membrane protein insertion efficiency factor YidD [bacterium]|nr:membrane protein insertion efficiency factor YidD [bacterium]